MTKPFTVELNAAHRWCILHYGKHVGLELSVPTEAQAQSTADKLNSALQVEFGRGYDSGQNDASRRQHLS